MRRGLLLLLFLTMGTVVGAGEEVITARLEWEASRLPGATAKKVMMAEAVPEGVTAPKGARKPLYGKLSLGSGPEFVVVLDLSMARPRTWLDKNGDGSLADEQASTWSNDGAGFKHVQTIPISVEGEKEPVPVQITMTRSATCEKDHVHLYPQIHRRGTVVLGGRVRLVALVDGDADLKFDDAEKDRLYVDLDGDGRFTTGDGSHERVIPGKAFRAGDLGYSAKVTSPSGQAVEFQPISPVPKATPRRWSKLVVPAAGRKPAKPKESLRTLIRRFESERSKPYLVRRKALDLIGREGSDEAFQWLVKLSESGDTNEIRIAAVRGMGNRHYKPDHGQLMAIAKSAPTPAMQAAALDALHLMDAPLRKELYFTLVRKSNETLIVGAAARNLAYLGTDEGKLGVVSAFFDRPAPGLRYQTYNATRYFPDGPPIDVVRKAIREGNTSLKARGIQDLHALGFPEAYAHAVKATKEKPMVPALAFSIIAVLGSEVDRESVANLVKMASIENGQVQERLRAALRPIRSKEAVEVYLRTLKSKIPAERALAAEMLAAIPDKKTTDRLMRMVKKERDPDALVAAIEALGEHQDPRAVDILLKAARSKDPARRTAAVRALATLGAGNPRVRAFFLKLFRSNRWTDRIFALDAAGDAADVDLADKVIANLSHKQWQVRLAAAQALRTIRVKEAVEPLIRHLSNEESKRVRAAIAEALFKITGQHFYDFADIWARWWNESGAGFKVPVEVPVKPPPRQGGTFASFYGLPLDSDRVVFVIDQSGSMSASDPRDPEGRTRLQTAVSEVLAAVGRLKRDDRANVILFETGIHSWRDGKLVKLSPSVREELTKHLRRQQPIGGTNLYDGLELALLTREVDTIFLLSDGVPGAGKYTTQPDILRAVRRLNQTRRITIHCVSVGMDSSLLRALATANGGKYVRR